LFLRQENDLLKERIKVLRRALDDTLFGLEIANKENPNEGFKADILKAKEALEQTK